MLGLRLVPRASELEGEGTKDDHSGDGQADPGIEGVGEGSRPSTVRPGPMVAALLFLPGDNDRDSLPAAAFGSTALQPLPCLVAASLEPTPTPRPRNTIRPMALSSPPSPRPAA